MFFFHFGPGLRWIYGHPNKPLLFLLQYPQNSLCPLPHLPSATFHPQRRTHRRACSAIPRRTNLTLSGQGFPAPPWPISCPLVPTASGVLAASPLRPPPMPGRAQALFYSKPAKHKRPGPKRFIDEENGASNRSRFQGPVV